MATPLENSLLNGIKMKYLFSLFLILCMGCSSIQIDQWELAKFEGINAFASTIVGVVVPIPKPTECSCGGTKKVKSGDGLLEIPCPCGENCKCKVSTKRQILIIGTSWCKPCKNLDKDVMKLAKEGWKIGEKLGGDEHILILTDLGEEIEDKMNIQSYPTIILMENDKEIDRNDTMRTKEEISHYYYKKIEKSKGLIIPKEKK